MPYKMRGPGLRWMRSLLNLAFGGENVFRPDSSADAMEMELNESVQPVLVINSLRDNPFDSVDERITTEVYNPFDASGAEVPLKVQEVNPPPITIETPLRQFIRVVGLKSGINIWSVTGDRLIGPFTTPILGIGVSPDQYNLLHWGIIRDAMIRPTIAGFHFPWLFGAGNRYISLALGITWRDPSLRSQPPQTVDSQRLLDYVYVGGPTAHNPQDVIDSKELFLPVPLVPNRMFATPTVTATGYYGTDTVGTTEIDILYDILIEVWSTGGSREAPWLRNNAQWYPFVDGFPVNSYKIQG